MWKKGPYLFAAVGLVLLLFVLHLKWSFWEPSGFPRDSWIYLLKVPAAVKTFPLWSPSGEPRYAVRVADGLKPSTTTVNYRSSADLDRLAAAAASAGLGCLSQGQDSTRWLVCERVEEGRVVQAILEPASDGPGTRVDVNFMGY